MRQRSGVEWLFCGSRTGNCFGIGPDQNEDMVHLSDGDDKIQPSLPPRDENLILLFRLKANLVSSLLIHVTRTCPSEL
jgi:hypothetical protein